MERKAGFSGFLGETISLLGDAFRGVVLFALVVGGLNAVGIALALVQPGDRLVGFHMGFQINTNAGLAEVGFQLLTLVVSVVASYLLLAHFLETRGQLPVRKTRIWAYVGLSILTTLGLILGFILLIVPGLILVVRWSAASGFLIGARKSITDSLSASWMATRGHGWSIFGAGLVLFIGMAVIGGVLGSIEGAASSATSVTIVASFIDAIGTAVFLAFGIAIFLLVHNDGAQIGEVFA